MIKLRETYEYLYNRLSDAKPLFLNDSTNQILLRHDVDHSIDLALLLSEYEKEREISSTYFILHTADYFNNNKTLDKIKKIIDNGHEVGLHTNFLEEWFLKNHNIQENLEKNLNFFYKNKIKIKGLSAHGAKSCYSEKFINSWIFEECKYKNEIRNAEDIIENKKEYQIHLPETEILKNRYNNTFKMWSIKLQNYDLYYAHNLNYKNYITDSGNSFARSDDLNNLKSAQVNLHPEHVLENYKFKGNDFDINDLNFFKNKFKKVLSLKKLETNRFIENFCSKKNKIIIQMELNRKTKFKINLFELNNNDDDRHLISSTTFLGDNLTVFNSVNFNLFIYKIDVTIYEKSEIKSLDIFEA